MTRIAVTYENGEVFQHFGRTAEFKVYEIEDGRIVSSEVRSTMGRGHGELINVLRDFGVSVLICGGIGGGARNGLMASGIRVCSGNSGSADEVARAYAEGTLDMCSETTCNHHGEDHVCTCGKH
ncbi:MAG: NifB/NifX family molybdenum-iron cluster-binding protein [Candidatus Methanomethylophilaceae archaeon]|nr:NifB/NifX family molybdenum-iron cluster-binding protein [Candidatus Methanomethylophilaceae archaeon]